MVKTFPTNIFWTTLLITIVVFLGGLLLGWSVDGLRSGEVLDGLEWTALDTESYLVEQSFWDSLEGDDCAFAEPRLNSLSSQLTELGQYLTSYEKKSLFADDEFVYLTRRYFILEIQAYVLYTDLRENCGVDHDVILYFYGTDDSASETQGYVLDRVVSNSEGSVDIFSINKDFEGDAAVDTLLLYYNVTQSPTMIVNGETKVEGYTSYQEILDVLDADFS